MALSGINRVKSVTVVPQTPGGLARAFRFDVALDMVETNPGSASRHPVQNGSEGIVDNVRRDPPTFSVSGLVSDTPVEYFTLPGDRAIDLYQLIKDIRKDEVLVTVITSWLPLMRDMWSEVIEGRRGQDTGAAIEISINFAHIRIATTQVIPALIDSDVLALGSQTIQTGF